MDTAEDPRTTARRPPDRLPFHSCGNEDVSPLPRRAAGGDPTSRRQVPLLDADGSAPGGRLLSESRLSRAVLPHRPSACRSPRGRPAALDSPSPALARSPFPPEGEPSVETSGESSSEDPHSAERPLSRPAQLGSRGRTQTHFLGRSGSWSQRQKGRLRGRRAQPPGGPLPSRCSRGARSTVSAFPLWPLSPARPKPARAPSRTPRVSATLTDAWALTRQASWSGQRERTGASCPEGGHLKRSVRKSRDTWWARTFWKASQMGIRCARLPMAPALGGGLSRAHPSLPHMPGLPPSASAGHGNWALERPGAGPASEPGAWSQMHWTPRPRSHAACLRKQAGTRSHEHAR